MNYKIIVGMLLLLLPLVTIGVVFQINQPGVYVIGTNIVLNSNGPDTAILINASNVTLDCNNQTLSQSNLVVGGDGITISPFLNNIIIKNGVITNFTNRGIVVGQGSNRIIIDNMFTSSCNFRGIEAIGTVAHPIQELTIQNSSIENCCQGTQGDAAIFIQQCIQTQLDNVNFQNNGLISNTISAVRMDNCTSGKLLNVDVRSTIGSNIYGFNLSTAQGLIFQECNVRHTIASNTNAAFIAYEFQSSTTCKDILLQDCLSFDATATIGLTASTVGFHIGSTSVDFTLENCKVIDHSSTGTSIGFSITPNVDIFLNNCLVQGIGSTFGNSQGYVITGGNTVNLSQCRAHRLVALSGIPIGFFLNGLTLGRLSQCSSFGFSGAVSVGYEIDNCIQCVFLSNSASQNIGNSDNNSFGFRINQGLTPDTGDNIFVQNQAQINGFNVNNQMNNFLTDTFDNWNFNAITSLTWPFTNLGVVP